MTHVTLPVPPTAREAGPEPPRDSLTGLPGFDQLHARLAELTRRGRKPQRPFALSLFDLDSFGEVNERHGRAVGDAIIRAFAGHLRARFPEPAEVYRYGGDAIGVVLPGMDKEEAFLAFEAARAAFGPELEVTAESGPVRVTVGVSCGVAASPEDSRETQNLLRMLQAAIYRAKLQGPGKSCLAREEKMVTKTSHYTQGSWKV